MRGGAEADRSLAVALSVALAAGAAVLVPVGVAVENALFGLAFRASAGAVARTVVPSLLVPLGAGFAFGAWWPAAAERLRPVVNALALVTLVAVGVLALVATRGHLGKVSAWGWAAGVGVVLGAIALGELASRGRPADRRIVVDAVVLGNPGIALFVANASYPEMKLAPYVILFVLVRALVLALYELARRSGPEPGARGPLGARYRRGRLGSSSA